MAERQEAGINEEMLGVMDYVFDLPENAVAALDGQIPMTWELFQTCLEYCTENHADELFFRLLQEYPEYVEKSAENL